ncbi:MAG: HD domain-containing protein [Candidatus Hydrogenedentes bacterium]|nr:HD domain-containing protein [Candidatus Hydrogenedentota bacterium]HNZ19778.1 HD domain-containing protein [Candidatus Hydrogenedentota bacterium]HOH35269.1 HD domain-containing protein [Candidatus Hydrogenedentota bacterium]HPV36825.1 HD domain-containing protein [Candidatus Hydrogenedentota bacterium]HQH68770.1 HD domain-containing protein [Candidatus Hydrogenedentota bacterium]
MRRCETIRILTGPRKGESCPVSGTLTIGRSPDSGLQLNEPEVSRKHAVIQQTALGTLIRDLGSGNGTSIRNRRIVEYRLSHGDVISIGPIDLLFESLTTENLEPRPPSTVVFEDGGEENVQALTAENVHRTFFSAALSAQTVGQARKAQERLAAVYAANQVISSERDLNKLFERVLDQIFELVPAHNGAILLAEPATGRLEPAHMRKGPGADEHVTISSTIVRRAYDQGEAILVLDAADDSRLGRGQSIILHNIASAMCTPLQVHDEKLGVLYVDTRGTTNAFTDGDLELLVALAGPAAIAIKNAQYVDKLESAYQGTLVMTANAIEARDHYTVGHTWRVTNFAIAIARELGWDHDKLRECEMGGVLHDVGKIAIDDAILRKPGGLTDDEYAKMKVHPERGARMMQDVPALAALIPYALYHHERYDGRGYPFGLRGEEIPIEGRLIAVADTFDAMTSNRPYRKGLGPEAAVAELEKGKGTQFDPVIVDAMIQAYRAGRVDATFQNYAKDDLSVSCPFCSTYVPVPEGGAPGVEFKCGVCHRRLRLREQNDVYFAELLPSSEASPADPGNRTPRPAAPALDETAR